MAPAEPTGTDPALPGLVAAAVAGDPGAFAQLTARHRRELHVHCYRMLGSFDEAEDLVQETFLRAWDRRSSFDGSVHFRAWLYRIATNACLDALARHSRREVPHGAGAAAGEAGPPSIAGLPWLQPYPQRLLDEATPAGATPEQVVAARETVELSCLAALQLLAPRPRAVLLLRDVVGWPATEVATALGVSVAAVNSALQRARAALRRRRPAHRLDWRPARGSAAERDLVRRFVDAQERYDVEAMVALAAADIRMTAPPDPRTWDGRDAFAAETAHGFGPGAPGPLRSIATGANGHPAVATYLRRRGDTVHRPFALCVLHVEGGALVELTMFSVRDFAAFALPPALPA